MRLAFLTSYSESLDDLQEMVVPMFCEVKNTNKVRPQWLEHPYGEGQVKVIIHIL